MSIETAVNGFGRIGTLYSRVAIDDPETNLLAINAGGNADTHDVAVRLEHDSVHREFGDHVVDNGEGFISVDEASIAVYGFRNLEDAPWAEVSDSLTVIESTGSFVTTEAVQGHLDAGADKVVITAPARDIDTPTIVIGANDTPEKIAEAQEARVASASSCSTNDIAPIIKILSDNFDTRWGSAKIPHAYTGSQRLLDGRGTSLSSRRGVNALIPASTGSAKEIHKLFPDLDFFHAESMRVPIPDGSVAMLTVGIAGRIAVKDVVDCLEEASQTTHRGIVNLSERQMYSDRVLGNSASTTIHPGQISLNRSGNMSMINLQAWFDNEWGYVNRVSDVAKLISKN